MPCLHHGWNASLRFICAAAIAWIAAAALAPVAALAQAGVGFPNKPVTLVVPFTANSGSDIIARVIGPRLQARWGQPVVVDNKPGASGNLGASQVAKAAPDGSTLLMAINTFTMTPSIYKNMPFDSVADFAAVTKLAEASYAFAVHPAMPVKDMAGLLAYLKKNPGKLNYASPGNGTPHHLAMELLRAQTGLEVLHVPYKGIAGAITDLMSGQVQMMFATLHSVRPYALAGKLRLLAVTGPARHPLAPEVPTFREQGIEVMDSVDAWYGVLAPAKTPPETIARLNADFVAVLQSDDIKAELARLGLQVRTGTPAQLSELIKSDLQRWHKVVSDAGITAD